MVERLHIQIGGDMRSKAESGSRRLVPLAISPPTGFVTTSPTARHRRGAPSGAR